MSTTTKKFSGWSVLVGCACLMFFGNAIIAGTTSLFMAPICQSLSFDVAAYSVILLISSLAAAVSSMILAPYMQKGNMKMIMLACAIIAAVSYAGMGLCTQLWQFYLLFGICNLGYGAITQLPVAMLITAWFDDKRSVAMSIGFVGNSFGTSIWAILFSSIMAKDPMGWTNCYFLGGVIILVV
ncbi:MAG: MFS transporter, partial [Oscillospiraceae bacterium]